MKLFIFYKKYKTPKTYLSTHKLQDRILFCGHVKHTKRTPCRRQGGLLLQRVISHQKLDFACVWLQFVPLQCRQLPAPISKYQPTRGQQQAANSSSSQQPAAKYMCVCTANSSQQPATSSQQQPAAASSKQIRTNSQQPPVHSQQPVICVHTCMCVHRHMQMHTHQYK